MKTIYIIPIIIWLIITLIPIYQAYKIYNRTKQGENKINVNSKTKLQIKFEEQTPSIKDVTNIEYLQTYCSWLEYQLKNKVKQ